MPQHFLGLLGMPRRVYTYHAHGLWEAYNMASSIGSYVMAIGMLAFVVNVVKTTRTGARAGNDPWVAYTLEWYTTSPPPPSTMSAWATTPGCARSPEPDTTAARLLAAMTTSKARFQASRPSC